MEKSSRSTFRERRRIAILESVVRVLAHTNYEQMTMEAVALEAGVTKPTLYAYFANKEVLVMEAVDRQLEMATEELCRLDAIYPPRKAILEFAAWAVDHRFLDGDALPGSTICHFQSAAPFQQVHRALISRLEHVLLRARLDGILDPTIDISLATQFVLTSIRDFSLRDSTDDRVFATETVTFLRLIENALFPATA